MSNLTHTHTHTKRIEAEKNWSFTNKVLCKLKSIVGFGKLMENVRNRIDVKLVCNIKKAI